MNRASCGVGVWEIWDVGVVRDKKTKQSSVTAKSFVS